MDVKFLGIVWYRGREQAVWQFGNEIALQELHVYEMHKGSAQPWTGNRWETFAHTWPTLLKLHGREQQEMDVA